MNNITVITSSAEGPATQDSQEENPFKPMDKNPPSRPPHIQETNHTDDESVLIHWNSPPREDTLLFGTDHLRSTVSHLYTFIDNGCNSYNISLPGNMTCKRMLELDYSGTCKVLRDMIHMNDRSRSKFSLHGVVGKIHHVVLTRFIVDLTPFDLQTIKMFLEMYWSSCREEGQKLLRDKILPLFKTIAEVLN